MRINGQEFSLKMPRGQTDLAQGCLQTFAVGNCASGQQMVDRRVRGNKGQSIGELKPSTLMYCTVRTNSDSTDRCFVNQLHSQPRFHSLARLPRPSTQKIPRSQSQMLGDQEPDTGQVASDLVGKKLAYTAFDAARITWFRPGTFPAGTCLQCPKWFRTRAALIKFFFEARSRRLLVRHCVC